MYPLLAEVELWQIFASLGVPGLAFGVFYMLMRVLKWRLPAVPRGYAGPALILFMLLAAGITLAALILYRPIHKEPTLIGENILLVTEPADILKAKQVWTGQQFRLSLKGLPVNAKVEWTQPKVGRLSGLKGNEVSYQAIERGREEIVASISHGTEELTREINFDVETSVESK